MSKYIAEFIGTFWLVLGGCGSAVISAGYPELGIGFTGVALAFGLSVLTMVYAVGHISGAHLNPAVSVGAWISKRLEGKELLPYIVSQILGAIAGASVLYIIASGQPNFKLGNFAANGYGEHSPAGYGLVSAFITETVMTFIFMFIILSSTSPSANTKFAGIAIGLALTLIHLVSIPITNTSVNPARSISQAIFVGGWALKQLWLFIVAPILGAVIASFVYRFIHKDK